jgi:hypothetical protein
MHRFEQYLKILQLYHENSRFPPSFKFWSVSAIQKHWQKQFYEIVDFLREPYWTSTKKVKQLVKPSFKLSWEPIIQLVTILLIYKVLLHQDESFLLTCIVIDLQFNINDRHISLIFCDRIKINCHHSFIRNPMMCVKDRTYI